MKNTCEEVNFFVKLPKTLLKRNFFTDNSQRFNQGKQNDIFQNK